MEHEAVTIGNDAGGAARDAVPRGASSHGGRSVEVRVPASTSNLGAGFDCFGLALRLYLTVRATVAPETSDPCRVRSTGEGRGASLPNDGENLIFRAMCLAAEREGLSLPHVRLAVRNEIPLGRGLGSSAAAIVAGLTLSAALCGRELPDAALLRYAAELEGHADNVAASLLGGWVTTCVREDGEVLAVKRRWPQDTKLVVVSPHVPLETARARAALPREVARTDAVHNVQRAALFSAALEGRADELLWEATRDRLHQPHRERLVPGLAAALSTPRRPGLLGLALSGAGPSVVALAREHFEEIGEAVASGFRGEGVEATVRLLEVDEEGRRVRELVPRRRQTFVKL
jgi:homoserine kinase